MLKFAYNKYQLQPITQIGALAENTVREGAILRVEWPDGIYGFADLFPWPELNDADLDTQLIAISKGRLSYLVEQTIWLARRDALARAEKKKVFQTLTRIKNHFLINDPLRLEDATIQEMKTAGFTTLKAKMGRNLEEEFKWVERFLKQHKLMLRLDFNSKLTYATYRDFANELNPAFRARIEYVEDPFPFDLEQWRDVSTFMPLALDNEYDNVDWADLKGVGSAAVPFKVLIIKPARQDVDKCLEKVNKYNLKFAVTSAMDHAVGIAHASWVAGELKKTYPNVLLDCGCLSQRAYRATDFTTSMILQGPYLVDIPGHGIGFDMLFERMEWEPISLFK